MALSTPDLPSSSSGSFAANKGKAALLGLNADHFRHPLDREATQALKKLPGLDVAIRSLIGPMGEQFFYLENIAASVLVGPNQLPDLYHAMVEACEVLDLEGSPVSDKSLKAISKMSKLSCLVIRDTNISNKGVDALTWRMPQLWIWY